MEVLTGLVAMVAVVLSVSGVLKLVDPQPTVDLLAGLGLPRWRAVPILVGVAELVVGVAVLAVGGPVATAATSLLFAAFAVLTVVTIRRAPDGTSCGCFGRLSTPPGPLHVGVDVGAGLLAALAAVLAPPALADVVADQPWGGAPYLLLVLVGASLLMVLTTALADALAAARPDRRRSAPALRFDLPTGDRS